MYKIWPPEGERRPVFMKCAFMLIMGTSNICIYYQVLLLSYFKFVFQQRDSNCDTFIFKCTRVFLIQCIFLWCFHRLFRFYTIIWKADHKFFKAPFNDKEHKRNTSGFIKERFHAYREDSFIFLWLLVNFLHPNHFIPLFICEEFFFNIWSPYRSTTLLFYYSFYKYLSMKDNNIFQTSACFVKL